MYFVSDFASLDRVIDAVYSRNMQDQIDVDPVHGTIETNLEYWQLCQILGLRPSISEVA